MALNKPHMLHTESHFPQVHYVLIEAVSRVRLKERPRPENRHRYICHEAKTGLPRTIIKFFPTSRTNVTD
jgi:hypothetical protein